MNPIHYERLHMLQRQKANPHRRGNQIGKQRHARMEQRVSPTTHAECAQSDWPLFVLRPLKF
jgi:hypothetical protein